MDNLSENLISIIIPCFNSGEFVHQSVTSVLDQTYQNLEVLAIDDGSTDDTALLLRRMGNSDKRVKVFHQKNRGAAAARNRGLYESNGDFIAFLDSDDYWHPECLERLYCALTQSHASIAYCGWQNVGLPGGRGQPFIPPDYSDTDKVELFLGGCPWPIHAALTRRACIRRVGGFDEYFRSCEDYSLWLRLAPFINVVRVSQVLAYYRHHNDTQVTGNRARIALDHFSIQMKFLQQHPYIVQQLGKRKVRELTLGRLLHRAFACYWRRDLEAARKLFHFAMKHRYGSFKDWKYMLPSLLPLTLYRRFITTVSKTPMSSLLN